jgi:DNA helicase IV
MTDPPDPDPHSTDPELAAEQRHLDHAHACLGAMRARAGHLATVDAAQETDSEAVRYHLRRRLASFDGAGPLCFGRIDTDDGDRWHVGRRHVEDDRGDPVVVDWRAPVSAPFYRATVVDPLGLVRRLRYSVADREILALHDEDLTDPDAAGGGIPDPLLAELERGRTGEMRDIVATIQAEQDAIIRAPLERTLLVQGGPGSGKTAVGLHRAAYLLYEHRLRFLDQRALVLGPNRVFLRYIAEVLPSLGETSVVQTTIEGLLGARYRVRAVDAHDVAALKGDARMAALLRRGLAGMLRTPTEPVELSLPWGRVRLPPDDVVDALDAASSRRLDHGAAREVFRALLARRVEALLLPEYRGEAPAGSDFPADARAHPAFRTLVDRSWPTVSAPVLVRRLLSNRRALDAAADGLLDADERAALRRRAAKKVDDEPWTLADLPLLDEAEALVGGVRATYGHVVVDEAQDLSAMALRMVARRAPHGSATVLGDLAQATSPGAQSSWADVAAHLGAAEWELAELDVGYRVPGPVLDLAARLLPVAAPHVGPARSIREHGEAPWVTAVGPGADLPAAAAERVGHLASEWGTVGVIAPTELHDPLAAALGAADVAFGRGARVGLDEAVTLLDPATAKGLELDAVVVVEPGRIAGDDPAGHRALYVAMTRCVQHLSVLHADPLPAALTA